MVRDELRVNELYICLRRGDSFVPVCSAAPLKPTSFKIAADHPCVRRLEEDTSGRNQIILKEFEANPLYKSVWGAERELLESLGVSCICALRDGDSVIGLLLLSDKEKGVGYSYGDFSFLSTVSAIASIAVQNATLYRQVAEREHLFSSMTAFIPNVILIKPRGESDYCFVSANTERVLGYSQEYFTSRSAVQTLRENFDEKTADEVIKTMNSTADGSLAVDIPYHTGDGRDITLRCVFSAIVSGGIKSHYVCVATDVSRDIEAQLLLKNSVELAQASNRAKGEFLSHMSHEIRTPLNSVAGLSYLAREAASEGDMAAVRANLEQLDQSSQYLLSMLNNIMDMDKIESRKYEINAKPFDISSVLDEVYSVFAAQMSSNGVDFTLERTGVTRPDVLGDEISLRKILNNLLSNACKFTPEGGSVSLTATQSLSDKGSVLRIVVADTGIGMSESFVEHIFEPYTQEGVLSAAVGSGLGMTICKSIVDLQGGSISVSGERGRGSRFTVELPYSLCDVEESGASEADFSAIDGRRIMVVDDVRINSLITARLLEKRGASVDCAADGEEALKLFVEKPDYYYDCILLDIQMPGPDGFETAARIRRAGRRCSPLVPILAMTADAFINESGLGDFNGCILKPIKPDELYSRLAEIFSERGNTY